MYIYIYDTHMDAYKCCSYDGALWCMNGDSRPVPDDPYALTAVVNKNEDASNVYYF